MADPADPRPRYDFDTGMSPSYTADVAAMCRAILARDAEAIDAIYGVTEDHPKLLIAACWLVIALHRAVLGDDPAAIDAGLADLQAQWLAMQARAASTNDTNPRTEEPR